METESASICDLYVPEDNIDAQYRVIPVTGVKFSAAINPRPPLIVKNRFLWTLLKWWTRNERRDWW